MKRSTRWIILLLVLFFLFFLVAGMTLGVYLFSRQGIVRSPRVLVFNVPATIPEVPESPGLTSIFGQRRPTLFEITKAIREAAQDDAVSALLMKISFLQMGWGQVQELRDALSEFRGSGKPLYAYLEFGDNREYYLSAVAEGIYMPPETFARFGLLSETTFYRKTMEKIKVKPQLEHVGKYKSASDIFMREEMSEEHRTSMNTLLDSLYDQMVRDIARDRSLAPETIKETFDRGLLSPDELVEAALIDAILYPDEVEDRVRDALNGTPEEELDKISMNDYARRTGLGFDFGKKKIALIIASGTISSGKSASGGWSEVIGSDTLRRQLRAVREDEGIQAVVLRIDSPGGSGFASDLIWREVELTRQEKPVVVSMSDLAASGGYYVAMPADYIYAQPGTLTGSIGVIAGKFVLEDLYEWAGMNVEILKRGKNSEMLSASQGFTEEQREILQANIRQFYDRFVEKAAIGRNMAVEEIDRVAQGRVWTGEQAQALGLVDELGNLQDALDKAKEMAGIPPEKEVALEVYPREKTFFEQFEQMNEVRASAVTDGLPEPVQKWMEKAALAERFKNEPALYLMPSVPKIR